MFTNFQLFEDVEKIPFLENHLTFSLIHFIVLLVDEIIKCEDSTLAEEKALELPFICQGKLYIMEGFDMLFKTVALYFDLFY